MIGRENKFLLVDLLPQCLSQDETRSLKPKACLPCGQGYFPGYRLVDMCMESDVAVTPIRFSDRASWLSSNLTIEQIVFPSFNF